MKISPLKLIFSLIMLAITSMLQTQAATKYFAAPDTAATQYFAAAGTMVGRYEIPPHCAVQYQKSTTEKISLFSPGHTLMGHVEIKYSITNGQVKQGYIPELEVSPDFQRDGIGSRLFKIAAHRLVCGIGVSRVSWDAAPFKGNISLAKLIEFYSKNGGEIVSRITGSAKMHLSIETLTALQEGSVSIPTLPEGCTLENSLDTTYEFWLCNILSTTPGKSTHYSFVAKQYPDDSDEWYCENGSTYSVLGREQQPHFQDCMLQCIANRLF